MIDAPRDRKSWIFLMAICALMGLIASGMGLGLSSKTWDNLPSLWLSIAWLLFGTIGLPLLFVIEIFRTERIKLECEKIRTAEKMRIERKRQTAQ